MKFVFQHVSRNHHAIKHRIRAFMIHTDRYAFKGVVRLADDVGLHRQSLSRILCGHRLDPGFEVIARIGYVSLKDGWRESLKVAEGE